MSVHKPLLLYFDENFDACEDVDFNYRVKKAGLKSYISQKLTVLYYPRSSALHREVATLALGQTGKRYGFQTSHTLPTKSGPGLRVVAPGVQPEGVASPVSRTCWNACT